MKPDWLKVTLPSGTVYSSVKGTLASLGLHTVCQEASCPNLATCWGSGTATFMILGDVCTRACRFCGVKTGDPGGEVDDSEPQRVATAVSRLGLKWIVLTSVDRDDLPDGGASQFADTVRAVRELDSTLGVETLIPDFSGSRKALKQVVNSVPHLLAHNLETVDRLTPKVRDRRCGYHLSLRVLRQVKELDAGLPTKSSLLLGLGEHEGEVVQAMRDLRETGVDLLTLGQYLQPTRKHLPVSDYIPPHQFRKYRQIGLDLGFRQVLSAPLARSSYRAEEIFRGCDTRGRAVRHAASTSGPSPDL